MTRPSAMTLVKCSSSPYNSNVLKNGFGPRSYHQHHPQTCKKEKEMESFWEGRVRQRVRLVRQRIPKLCVLYSELLPASPNPLDPSVPPTSNTPLYDHPGSHPPPPPHPQTSHVHVQATAAVHVEASSQKH